MSVDWDKPIQTKDGRPARVLGNVRVKQGNKFAIVVAVRSKFGEHELVLQCRDDGALKHSKERIINVPQKYVLWMNVYRDDENRIFLVESDTKEDADASASKGRIACVRVEFEEGEGL